MQEGDHADARDPKAVLAPVALIIFGGLIVAFLVGWSLAKPGRGFEGGLVLACLVVFAAMPFIVRCYAFMFQLFRPR